MTEQEKDQLLPGSDLGPALAVQGEQVAADSTKQVETWIVTPAYDPAQPQQKKTTMSTWLITGASSGLGRSLAHAVLKAGHNAVITARNPSSVQDLVDAFPDTSLAVPLEVSNHAQVEQAEARATERFGGVDVLVNNAGHGYRAAVKEASAEEVDELFATNFFGPVDLLKQVLPKMRERRAGTIVNVSSIGAPRSNSGSGYYTATKTALEGVSEALNRKVAPPRHPRHRARTRRTPRRLLRPITATVPHRHRRLRRDRGQTPQRKTTTPTAPNPATPPAQRKRSSGP